MNAARVMLEREQVERTAGLRGQALGTKIQQIGVQSVGTNNDDGNGIESGSK